MASSTTQYDAKVHPMQAELLTQRGATDREIAEFFGISPGVFYNWRTKHPEFCNALKDGKEIADDRVERSLYNRAVGYDYDAVKIVTVSVGNNGGSVVEQVPYVEHVPPDVKAAIRWLEARRPKVWRRTVGLTGGDGGPIQLGDGEDELAGLTDNERAQLRGLLSKAAAGPDAGRGEG